MPDTVKLTSPPVSRVYRRDAIEFIPLTPKILGVATSNYTIQVQPHGTDSDLVGTWSLPNVAGSETGYLVNGPTLGGGSPGEWDLYVKISDSPQTPVRLVVIIRLT